MKTDEPISSKFPFLINERSDSVSSHKLVIKPKNEVPQEIYYGIEINRTDLRSNFDEADYVIQQQVHSIVKQGDRNSIKIISSDTDAFVLLCSNFLANDWSSANIFMETFIDNSKLININKSVECNKDIVPSLVALHALTGCDSVPMMFGIGKAKGLKVLKETALTCVGKRSCAMKDVFDEGFKFVASCYNRKDPNSSKNRQSLWMMKTDGAHKGSSPPALKSLPPTNEALEMNIMRAHYTAILWNESVSGCMPNIDPCQFGWETVNKSLMPIKLPNGVEVAPQEVLEMTRCKCLASGCRTKRCSCQQAGLFCSELCGCKDCKNKKPDYEQTDSDSEDEEEYNYSMLDA